MVPHVARHGTHQRFLQFQFISPKRLLQHGVIPGSSQTKARESALQECMRPASCGLATMESDNGILCRTGRIVEADINLRGGPGRIGCARGGGRFRSRGDIGLRDFEGTECSTHWPRDRTYIDVVMDRAQATWPASDLYRRAPCQGGAQDADQQK